MASENGPVLRVRPAGLAAALGNGLTLAGGRPAPRLVAVDLDGLTPEEIHVPPARRAGVLLVGISTTAIPGYAGALCSSFDLTLLPEEHERSEISWQVGVPDVAAAIATLTDTVTRFPTAAHTLAGLLRLTAASSAEDGLMAESLAYSMLMAGDEHAGWLAGRSRREIPPAVEPVSLERTGGVLTVALNRPERHNAFGREVRDGLVDAFDLVAADDSIERVRLIGKGQSFCSGGDLDEFGLTSDVTVAHLVRVDRSVAARLDAVRERVEVELHGACIGAGIELSSFAGRVVARPGTRIQLPELAMGLVPGAGGTVGITRRIGRWRTAWVVLSGEPLFLDTAVRWGLVDELVP